MSPTDIEARLAALDRADAFAAVRFDDAAPLTGRIAVLPSAFNPPTLAHLHLLEQALELDGITGAAAMLSTRNVSKGVVGASLSARVAMLLEARTEAAWMAALAVSAARLVDQAAALSAAFPGADFDFVVGHDTLVRLFDPVYYGTEDVMARELEPFFARHRVIAANRGDAGIDEVHAVIRERGERWASSFIPLEIDEAPASLSSTGAREAASQGRSPAAVPAPVRAYIETHRLYRTADS